MVFFQYKLRYLVVSKNSNPPLMRGWHKKTRPLQTQFVITRQAS